MRLFKNISERAEQRDAIDRLLDAINEVENRVITISTLGSIAPTYLSPTITVRVSAKYLRGLIDDLEDRAVALGEEIKEALD